jgi:cell division protein FtsB
MREVFQINRIIMPLSHASFLSFFQVNSGFIKGKAAATKKQPFYKNKLLFQFQYLLFSPPCCNNLLIIIEN